MGWIEVVLHGLQHPKNQFLLQVFAIGLGESVVADEVVDAEADAIEHEGVDQIGLVIAVGVHVLLLWLGHGEPLVGTDREGRIKQP